MRRVLSPELSFDDLALQLHRAGWSQVPIPGLLLPLIPGEPEQARFECEDQLLIYSFNPALKLRVIEGDGRLPTLSGDMDAESVASRLQDPDPRYQLWAMLAAAELDLQKLQPDIARLAALLPEELRHVAAAALMRLTPPVLPDIDQQKNRGKGTFAVLTDTLKIQILRQTLQADPDTATQLVPHCWSGNAELTATAILASARLRLVDQARQIRRADLSALSNTGHDREVFTALRKAALETLEGKMPLPGDTAPRQRFWRAVLGQPDGLDPALILTTLATPQPERDPEAPAPSLYSGGPLFQQIPALAHWLGHGFQRGIPSPVRRWTPPAAYMICETALRDVDIGGNGSNVVMTANPDTVLSELSDRYGRSFVVPDVEAWEAAMRGVDGRAHPWGMLSTAPSGMTHSPWGMLPSGVAEWARRGDQLVLCGTDLQGHVGYIRESQVGDLAAVRAVRY